MKKIYADTANLEEIKKLHSLNLIKGVTTNPSIISKEPKQDFNGLIENLWSVCADNNLSFSVEVFTVEVNEIINQAKNLFSELMNIRDKRNLLHIKVPIGVEEIKAVNEISNSGINVNCTCCYNEQQMQLASLSGAKYVSLFFNRAKDQGVDVKSALQRTSDFIKDNQLNTEIISGSIRKPSDISDAWCYGSDIVTCDPKIINSSLYHEHSVKSIEGFMKDFKSWIN